VVANYVALVASMKKIYVASPAVEVANFVACIRSRLRFLLRPNFFKKNPGTITTVNEIKVI
jgi:hypothetical protein